MHMYICAFARCKPPGGRAPRGIQRLPDIPDDPRRAQADTTDHKGFPRAAMDLRGSQRGFPETTESRQRQPKPPEAHRPQRRSPGSRALAAPRVPRTPEKFSGLPRASKGGRQLAEASDIRRRPRMTAKDSRDGPRRSAGGLRRGRAEGPPTGASGGPPSPEQRAQGARGADAGQPPPRRRRRRRRRGGGGRRGKEGGKGEGRKGWGWKGGVM